MLRVLLRIVFLLVLCSQAAYLMRLKFGASGLAFSAPLFRVALARPITIGTLLAYPALAVLGTFAVFGLLDCATQVVQVPSWHNQDPDR